MENIKDISLFDSDNKDDKSNYIQEDKECEKSEDALKEIRKDIIKSHYDIINIIVIGFLFLVVAVTFIVMTSSQKFGDEGNKFSIKRLFSGAYTKEIQERYDSTIPFPNEIKVIDNRISFIYGIGNNFSNTPEKNDNEFVDENQNAFDDESENNDHKELAVKTTTKKQDYEEQTDTKKITRPAYGTTFKKNTTTTTTTTGETTTTNNDAPNIEITQTVPPTTTTPTTTKEPETTTTKVTTEETTSQLDDSSGGVVL